MPVTLSRRLCLVPESDWICDALLLCCTKDKAPINGALGGQIGVQLLALFQVVICCVMKLFVAVRLAIWVSSAL